MTSRPRPPWLPTLIVATACVAVAAYGAAFLLSRMPSIESRAGVPFYRGQLLVYLTILDEFWQSDAPRVELADRLPIAGLAAGLIAWAAVVGWLVLKVLRVDAALGRVERAVFACGVGLNATSTYVLAVGLAGLAQSPWPIVAAMGITLIAAAWLLPREFRRWNRRTASSPRRVGPHAARGPSAEKSAAAPGSAAQPSASGPRASGNAWLWLAAPFALVIVLGGMLPPLDFDVREYHLQAPKEFYQAGRIGFLPHNVYANMPLGCEMAALAASMLTGDWWMGALAGKTVIACYALLTAAILWAAGRRFFAPPVGAIAAVVYLSTPWIVQNSSAGLIDAAVGFYLATALYALAMAWARSENDAPAGDDRAPTDRSGAAADDPAPAGRWFGLAGYLAGSAVACKYPAVLLVVVPLGVLGVWGLVRAARRQDSAPAGPAAPRGAAPPARRTAFTILARCGAMLLGVVLGCGLWLAKNAVLAGNPTYPLLYSVFGGQTWTPEKDARWNRVHRPSDFSPGTAARDLLRIGLTSEWLSPLVVPLAALGLVVCRKQRPVRVAAAYCLFVVAVWWLLTHRIDRFWLPMLPLAALLAGCGALWSPQTLWRRFAACFLIAGTLANVAAVGTIGGGYPPSFYAAPLNWLRDSPQSVLVSPWHRWLNANVDRAAEDPKSQGPGIQGPGRGCVLLVGDAQPFDLRVRTLYSTCFDDSPLDSIVRGRSADQIRREFGRRGITHVFVDWQEIDRYRRTYGFSDFIDPALFDRLAWAGVLQAVPPVGDDPGRCYRVANAPASE